MLDGIWQTDQGDSVVTRHPARAHRRRLASEKLNDGTPAPGRLAPSAWERLEAARHALNVALGEERQVSGR
jgi:hypothetical protein